MLNCKLQAVFQVALQGNVSTHPPLNAYAHRNTHRIVRYPRMFMIHITVKHTVAHRSFYVAMYGPQVKFVTTKKDLVKVSPIRQDIGTSHFCLISHTSYPQQILPNHLFTTGLSG